MDATRIIMHHNAHYWTSVDRLLNKMYKVFDGFTVKTTRYSSRTKVGRSTSEYGEEIVDELCNNGT